MHQVKITLLVENKVKRRGLLAEHGLSYWLEAGEDKILFDTGQTPEVLVHNARQLGIDLAETDTIVLSHGHYDHTGGLDHVLEICERPRLVLHPAATVKRYSRSLLRGVYEVGMPKSPAVRIESGAHGPEYSHSALNLGEGIFVTGEIPRQTDFEDTGGAFFLDSEGREPDPILDDQAIYFDTPEGVVVMLGCAHAGVVNTCLHVQSFTGHRPIRAIIGGFHLLQATGERLARTMDALRALDLKLLAPMHCTGDLAGNFLWFHFPDIWKPLAIGDQLEFNCTDHAQA